jgi:hypothetical protein
MALNNAIKGLISRGKRNRLGKNITKQRAETPKINEAIFLNLGAIFKASAIPTTVDNSATAFMEEGITWPLRTRIATRAITEVKTPGRKPKRQRDKTIGIPVKSNLSAGSQGYTIFDCETFME